MARWIFFLRALFPSWEFFVDAGPTISLEVRLPGQDWHPCLPQIKRSIRGLLFNPKGNLLHACHNNLLHMITDISNPAPSVDLNDLVSYRLTHNMVRFELLHTKKYLPGISYQFRVVSNSETILESPVYEL